MHILVVDDYPAILRTLQRLLKASGAHVVTAGGVAEAYDLANQAAHLRAPFDLVLSDIDMGDGTGFDLVRRLYREWPLWQPVVLFMTGDPSPARRALAAQLGAPLLEKVDLKGIAERVLGYVRR